VTRGVTQPRESLCLRRGGGRCRETGWLELHHGVPFARGGMSTAENLELRCRAHNAYEAERDFGARVPVSSSRAPRPTQTLSGQSSRGGGRRSGNGTRRGALVQQAEVIVRECRRVCAVSQNAESRMASGSEDARFCGPAFPGPIDRAARVMDAASSA
jgi:hypothetical protein